MIINDNPIIMENEGQNYTMVSRRPVAEITVVPNPAKDWAAFDYTLPNDDSQGVIRISDAAGKEITSIPISGKQGQQIWDTRMLKPGVYYYKLNAAGFSRHGKIVINK